MVNILDKKLGAHLYMYECFEYSWVPLEYSLDEYIH